MDELAKAKHYAISLLAVRSRSVKELEARLLKKHGKDVVAETLAFLKQRRLLDDRKYAGEMVSSANEMSPKSVAFIKDKLLRKGVSGDVIDRAIDGEGLNDREIASRLASERIKKLKGLPPANIKSRLYSYLSGRGFDYEVIDEVLRDFKYDINER